jgi:hypothetical protein
MIEDVELQVIDEIIKQLEKLENDADRLRAIAYVRDRLSANQTNGLMRLEDLVKLKSAHASPLDARLGLFEKKEAQ